MDVLLLAEGVWLLGSHDGHDDGEGAGVGIPNRLQEA